MREDADFPGYLRDQMAKHEWEQADLVRDTTLSQSLVSRWLSGKVTPSLENARILADRLGRPLLEVLVAAGMLTPAEANERVERVDVASLTDEQLVVELSNRLGNAHANVAPKSDVVESNGDRFVGVSKKAKRAVK